MRARKRPKKKLRITGFTDVPSARTADVSAASWEKLQSAVVAVQTSTAVDLSREELYSVRFAPPPYTLPPRCCHRHPAEPRRSTLLTMHPSHRPLPRQQSITLCSAQAVGDLCREKLTVPLYNRYVAVCDAHVAASIAALRSASPDPRSFLHAVRLVWEAHVEATLQLRNIFLALDRELAVSSTTVSSSSGAIGGGSGGGGAGSLGDAAASVRAGELRRKRVARCVPLWETGLALFRHHFCCAANAAVAKKTLASLLQMIGDERRAGTARAQRGGVEGAVGDGTLAPLLTALGAMYRQLDLYAAANSGSASSSSDSIATITVSSWLTAVGSAGGAAAAAPARDKMDVDVVNDSGAVEFRANGRAAARAREQARWREHVRSIALEAALLESTTSFFRKEGEVLLLGIGGSNGGDGEGGGSSNGAMDAAEYCRHVEWRMGSESQRCAASLAPTTAASIARIIDATMLQRHLATLLGEEKGTGALLEANARTDLKRIYRLCCRPDVSGRDALLDCFSRYVARRGRQLVSSSAITTKAKAKAGGAAESSSSSSSSSSSTTTSTLVVDLVAFRAKFKDIVQGAFRADRGFDKVARDKLEVAINASGSESPRLIAHFIDRVTRTPRAAVAVASRIKLAASPSQPGDAAAALAATAGGGGGGSSAAAATAAASAVATATTTLVMDQAAVLDACISLFRLVDAKDVFEATCRSLLVKRLLLTAKHKAPNYEAEGEVIKRLKAECGGAFTAKMEGMVSDVRTSAARVETQFMEWLAKTLEKEHAGTGLTPSLRHATLRGAPSPTTTPSAMELATPSDGATGAASSSSSAAAASFAGTPPDGGDSKGRGPRSTAAALGVAKFSVAVLTAGHWPERAAGEEAGFVLPRALAMASGRFEQFYAHHHANRKLRWVHALGTCVLLGRFKPKGKALKT